MTDSVSIIGLRENLDEYHAKRAAKHGWIYICKRRYNGIYEAKSVATGALCTLLDPFVEEAPHGQEAA